MFKNYYVQMIRFQAIILDVSSQKSDECYCLKGAYYDWNWQKVQIKKLKGWFEKDSEEFTVLCFGEHNIVGCVAPDGEKYVFDKDFLIDPDRPDEIYADITITKG